MKLLDKHPLGDCTINEINTIGLSVCHGFYEEGKEYYTIPNNILVLQYSIPGRLLQGLDARYIIKSILSGERFNIPELRYNYDGVNYYSPVKPFIYEPGDKIYNLSLRYREEDQISKINAFIGLYSINTEIVNQEGIVDIVSGETNIEGSLGNLINKYSIIARRLGYTEDKPFVYIQLSCKESIGNSHLMPFIDVANSIKLGFDTKFYSYKNSIDNLTDNVLQNFDEWEDEEYYWHIDRKLLERTKVYKITDSAAGDVEINDFLMSDYFDVFPYNVLRPAQVNFEI